MPAAARISGDTSSLENATALCQAVVESSPFAYRVAVANVGLSLIAIQKDDAAAARDLYAGIPQIKPTFLDIAPSGIPSNIIPHSKGIKCGLIRSNSPFSYSNHRPAKPKIPKPLVYAQVSPLGTSFATP